MSAGLMFSAESRGLTFQIFFLRQPVRKAKNCFLEQKRVSCSSDQVDMCLRLKHRKMVCHLLS